MSLSHVLSQRDLQEPEKMAEKIFMIHKYRKREPDP